MKEAYRPLELHPTRRLWRPHLVYPRWPRELHLQTPTYQFKVEAQLGLFIPQHSDHGDMDKGPLETKKPALKQRGNADGIGVELIGSCVCHPPTDLAIFTFMEKILEPNIERSR